MDYQGKRHLENEQREKVHVHKAKFKDGNVAKMNCHKKEQY